MARTYSTVHKAAEAWLGRYKRQRASGQPSGPVCVTVLGGGWWHIGVATRTGERSGLSPGRKVQGFHALGVSLLSRGQLRRVDGGYQFVDDGPGTPPGPVGVASAPAREAEPEQPAPAAPAVRLRQLEQDASALLAQLGALTAVYDSARTTAALGYVRLACEELKQARIVAEVRAKYDATSEAEAAWWPARREVSR